MANQQLSHAHTPTVLTSGDEVSYDVYTSVRGNNVLMQTLHQVRYVMRSLEVRSHLLPFPMLIFDRSASFWAFWKMGLPFPPHHTEGEERSIALCRKLSIRQSASDNLKGNSICSSNRIGSFRRGWAPLSLSNLSALTSLFHLIL